MLSADAAREYKSMPNKGVNGGMTMRKLIRDSGLEPPIGASPGEMRLWLKTNGFLDEQQPHKSNQGAVKKWSAIGGDRVA